MNGVDRFIRNLRISQAIRHIRPGSRVLDIGCHDGELFRRIGPALGEGIGFDPVLAGPLDGPRYRLEPGTFPEDVPQDAVGFDAITMLALLEHIPSEQQPEVAEACARLLVQGGVVIVTVPSPRVDPLLDLLQRFRVIDGMETGQHYGFDPSETVPLMEKAGLRMQLEKQFQFGLNNLFVFELP